MEFTRSRSAGGVELHLRGRLDGFRAPELIQELERLIKAGDRDIRLDLAEVSYLSSAGIGVIVKYHQDLAKQGGNLVVSVASAPVQKVLEMARLAPLVVASPVEQAPAAATARAVQPAQALLEVETLDPQAGLRPRIVGEPDVLRGVLVDESRAHRLKTGGLLLGLGIGAFGSDFRRCCDRFGDFVVVCGAAAYMPADGSNVADCVSGACDMVVLWATLADGSFSQRIRFRTTRLRELAKAGGVVMVGETSKESIIAIEMEGRRCAAYFAAPLPADNELRPLVTSLFSSGRVTRVAPPDSEELLLTGYCWVGEWEGGL
jgi:anti-sigma B factor antagonist